jgi:hypothetical protein
MLDRPVVVQDNALRRTSAWGNTFLGRDHFARRAQLPVIDAAAAGAASAVAQPAASPEKGPKA